MPMYDSANLAKMKTMKTHAPEAMGAFFTFNDAVFKDGVLSLKVKELIAVACAVSNQCVYCIDIHTGKAKVAGATEAELTEAILVASALKAGGAVTHGTHCLS